MKKQSIIGTILQVWAWICGILGGAMVAVALLQFDGTQSIMAAVAIGLFVASGVILLLGAAELLHAVMRTAAATEETVELLRAQGVAPLGAATRMNRQSAAPVLSGVGVGGAAGVQGEAAADFEQRSWRPAEESKCEVCHNFFTLPSKRQAQVTCPHCGVSGAWPE